VSHPEAVSFLSVYLTKFSESHVGPAFVKTFGETLTMLRKLFQTTAPASQGFVIAGSGTLGWDLVASNLIERGEDALVLNTGYFGDSFATALETYGAQATQLKAPIGERPSLAEIEAALKQKSYKIITVTHVDTSTGVLSDIKAVAELVRRVSPDTLVVVDGVCSVGCEEIAFDDWDLDVVLTASQKAIGCPPGLSILMLSGRAINRFKSRTTRPASYYASMSNWLPIMQNYEAGKPSYFATPPTQLIHALHTSLTLITAKPMAERFAIHTKTSDKVKATVAELGLTQLASKPENQSHAMTAIRLPQGLTAPDVLPGLMKRGVIFAAGLHKEIAPTYIRFGHMGVSVTEPGRNDIDKAIAALKEVYAEAKKAKGL
jgi:alanine-glyoxylate transaminase/serine-glyoxylate transaminase/serine-pyruvate transaminase